MRKKGEKYIYSVEKNTFQYQNYEDEKNVIEYKVKKTKFYKGMLAENIPKDLVGIEYEIIYQYYVLRYKLDKIGYNLNYSSDNIYKIKAKILFFFIF